MLIEDLESCAGSLFSKRSPLASLWQEISDHFYPERADFTVKRGEGIDFAAGLMTTYPILCRRDLGNSFSTLRPASKTWFTMTAGLDETRLDLDARRWLEWATGVQRRAMYDRLANFSRSTKEADHDFATFGQAVITVELGPDATTLLYRTWHLRDVCWTESETGQVDCVYHRWNPTVRNLIRKFPKTVSQTTRDRLVNEPHAEVKCTRVVMTGDQYGDASIRGPWVSVYYEVETKHILEIRPLRVNPYVIPRWQTVSGSQYAHSPATVCALPEARLLQAMCRVILEAGEKFTNPPLVAVQEALRSDVQLMAGGITWVDAEYDERLGEVLRPLTQDKSGMAMGLDMKADVMGILREAFFLHKLELPQNAKEMTAYEVSQRVSEYVRQALPLFEPMEVEYNGGVCELTFDVMLHNGAFGPLDTIPRSLRNQDVGFKFQSPLQAAIGSEKMAALQQSKMLLAQVADFDPSTTNVIDAHVALRDALAGAMVPASWMRDEREVIDMQAAQDEEEDKQKEAAIMPDAAKAAMDMAKAKQITETRRAA